MIQQLSNKYNKLTASILLAIAYNGMMLPAYASARSERSVMSRYDSPVNFKYRSLHNSVGLFNNSTGSLLKGSTPAEVKSVVRQKNKPAELNIGGPSQPEMSAFKSVGTDNMVNLFTGDFSYNIPLLDVGGYPVNIFYDGGVGMEQEASWVGLGWNINPGNVNRNMRGVPDDFNGEEKLVQRQDMKENITWGVTFGGDIEVVGIKNWNEIFKGKIGATIGVSVNNYLGPALEIGLKGNTNVSLAGKAAAEKSSPLNPSIGGSLAVNASSRNGVTFTPGLSLSANAFKANQGASGGFGLQLGTSYNSRSGIKALQISEQMSFNKQQKNDINKTSSIGSSLVGTSITFNKPSYVPSLRMPLTNSSISGHFQIGGSWWGIYPSAEIEVYGQKSRVASKDTLQKKPMIGYLYLQKAKNNADAVMDFTRVNDNEVTPSTPVISAPQYSYDVFSIQGEGTGGSIRAYRNDDGYVRDNYTKSVDENFSGGGDVGITSHYGGNFNTIKTPTTIGEWNQGNKLRSSNGVGFKDADNAWENVYFRNPGETSVLNDNQYNKIGNASLVRYALGGTKTNPTVEPQLEKFSKTGAMIGTVNVADPVNNFTDRKKRSQVISFLTAKEASEIGLDKWIKSYDGTAILNDDKNLLYDSFPRYSDDVDAYRKKHHISQINVTETSGQRYVYGIPVYNLTQSDFTFTVNNDEDPSSPDKVTFNTLSTNEATTLNTGVKDGYLQRVTTPAYSHSFLLSGLLSPDYVDVTNNGITEDDLGNAVKFNYSKMAEVSKWRTPLTNDPKANFNEGKRTENKDDKGLISYGERESWYVHSIESKTMIAIFKLESRHDSKGASNEFSGINGSDNSAKRLKQIDLYSKADLKKNGITNARPIKTVHFDYNYTLCKYTPNNTTAEEGKLTLAKIYFTFNGQTRASKNQYVFSYGASDDNPQYAFNASDRWGTYKPSSSNPSSAMYAGQLKNSDHPYAAQSNFPGINVTDEVNKKAVIDKNAGAWMLKKILLPSGGEMQVNYESDDYAFVQNRRAAVMMSVVGFGAASTATASDQLYVVTGTGIIDNNYAFIKVPEACSTKAEVYSKYLMGIEQLSFKLAVIMPNEAGKQEYLNSYAAIDGENYGVYASDGTNKTIWVKLKTVDNISPLSLTAIEFLREQLPGQAYKGYDVSESDGLKRIGEMLEGLVDGVRGAFTEPVKFLRKDGKAQYVSLSNCFVRLNDPDGFKYGGGYRVKSIKLKDNWKKMNQNQLYTSEYGQEYDYTTKETFNGTERTISSGVASYEPSLGGDENPFQTMIQVSNKVPLGPASYGAIEMPMLDAFFPSASVGYSKVTVRSVKKGTPDPTKKSRSGIGKQVTEFFTAKDYPVYYSNTVFDPSTDKEQHLASLAAFWYKYAFDSRALSQGFLIETNDMHGKMKSQASYAENDEKTAINFTRNFYRNTGAKGFDEKFDFVYASEGGKIIPGNMGIDVELMTDLRQFTVKSTSFEVQGQVERFDFIPTPIWIPFIWPVYGESENTYRAVTTTKVISYHSILDSVIVIDKGSQVSTKNLVYDAETGDVIVNRTNNEFKTPIYSTNYPAWWGYSGMGLAYKNIDAIYRNRTFNDGKLTGIILSEFESGDEIYIINSGSPSGCLPSSADIKRLWVIDKRKNTSSLTNILPQYLFIDDKGKPYNRSGVTFRIIRSGHRNVLNAQVASAVSMGSPIVIDGGNTKLHLDVDSKVINATAIEYKEKWQTDNEVFKKFVTSYPSQCDSVETENCAGHLDREINPYLKGLLGTFRASQNKVFYGSRKENDPTATTNLPTNGFLDDFKLYWNFVDENAFIPDVANARWVWNSQVTKINSKGLELETKDALGIYTAAQYGFNKTIPVAIANNSRNNEMFAEGFEDNDYNEILNKNTFFNPCLLKHIDLTGLTNASVVNTDALSFNAHTGKNVLKILANSQAIKTGIVSQEIIDSYNLQFGSAVKSTDELSHFGPVRSTLLPDLDQSVINAACNTLFGSTYMLASQIWTNNTEYSDLRFDETGGQYVRAPADGTYTFTLKTGVSSAPTGPIPDNESHRSGLYVTLTNLLTGTIYNMAVSQCNNIVGCSSDDENTYSFNLACGDYKIEYSGYAHYFGTQGHALGGSFSYETTGGFIPTVICSYTTPIAGKDSMLNPVFSVQPDKRMLFSAWIKEDCTTPCFKTDYDKSDIQIWSGSTNLGATTIKRTGPIIEGWQKIEGDFKLPVSATAAEIRFINTNSQPMYVDDIRIHPFNANMKSYVYDPVNLRLVAQLDANNYASFYEYDEEGTLIRTKVETKEGVKTVTETRSAKQKTITTID